MKKSLEKEAKRQALKDMRKEGLSVVLLTLSTGELEEFAGSE